MSKDRKRVELYFAWEYVYVPGERGGSERVLGELRWNVVVGNRTGN